MKPITPPFRLSTTTCALQIVALGLSSISLSALSINGYVNSENDRFSSGFPTIPLESNNANFVGYGLDWSGVAWSINTHESSSYKGLGMLSPKHFLTAQHYEYSNITGAGQNTKGVRVLGQDGQVYTAGAVLPTGNDITAVNNLGYGIVLTTNNGITDHDLAIGTLTTDITSPSNLTRLPLLDLNTSSSINSINNYDNLDILLYGRSSTTNGSPRVADTTVSNAANNGGDQTQPFIATLQTDATFVLGDSGSPALHKWTNPNGDQVLTALGVNSAVGAGENYISFLPVSGAITATQNVMKNEGYALRIHGEPSATWSGSFSSSINLSFAWQPTESTSDKYVLFDSASAATRSVSINNSHNLRGFFFKSTASGNDAFTFSGNGTLTIGRGGLTNYDDDTQVFSAKIALGSSQFWDTGSGGVQLATLDTNGHLLEFGGSGASNISGAISDSGSLALSSGELNLAGNSTYTGDTWIHGGILKVSGDISNSASITIGSYGTLSGSGTVSSIHGSGTVAPGSSPGILASEAISPANGLDFEFEFTAATAPDFDTPTASINDLIRLTDATPFTTALNASNTISIYLNVASIEDGQQYLGGFFTNQNSDFLSSISNATINYYIADLSGDITYNGHTYSSYTGPYLLNLSTELQSANFGDGLVSGRILQIEAEPDQSLYAGWKIYHSLTGNDALDTADTDDDSIGQLHEFAFGGDPNNNDISILPTFELFEDGESSYLELIVTRPTDLQGITYTPQTTADIGDWPADSNGIIDDDPTPFDNGDGTETLTYRRAQPVSSADQAFIRLEVIESP